MTCRSARRLLATALSAALVLLSPGLEAPRLFAQAITRAVPVQGAHPVVALPAAAPLSAPMSLTAPAPSLQAAAVPSALTAAPVAAAPVAAPVATPAAALAATARAIAPQLEAVSKAETGSDASRGAGQTIIDVLTGARSAGSGEAPEVAATAAAGISALSALSAASAPTEPAKPSVPAAAAPAAPKTVDSAVSYGLRRTILKAVAAITGAVYSLPSAGPAITAKLVAQASDKRVVLSDYDDTLASYNQVLPQEMVEAIQAVKAAGKDFVVISDRGDEKRAHQLTVFESLASLPAETRAGMYVAANSGGRVYRYDDMGEPVRVFEVPALDETSKSMVAQAAEAAKGRLKEVGAEQHFPSEGNNNPSESWGTYGYAMMLKVGSSEAAVRGAAAILEEELAKKGLKVEVNPRFAKDPANPPYINFSIVTKEASAGYIAKALNAQAKDVLIIGDSMYAPHEAKKTSWLTALASRLSGQALPKTGNATDRNMEKTLPGALTLGVGATGDPRASNLWVLDGKGPSVTRRVLMSVASKPRSAAKSARKPLTEEQARRRAELISKLKGALFTVGLIAATFGMYAAFFYAATHGPAASSGIQVPEGWQGPIPNDIDIGRMFGGVLGLAGVVGLVKGRAEPSPKVTDERIRAAAASVVMSKGMPWSQTEYNVGYYTTLENLKKDGATDAQIELYKKLCAEAPIRGGRFNPWSGD